MAVKRVNIKEFLLLIHQHPVLDVRSPGEYKHAHIPGAHSFPLFTDEERSIVGTVYKQERREKAIKLGLKFFGPKMVEMVESAENICSEYYKGTPGKTILVHCWRGGMRSGAVAWLLDMYGFTVVTLAGGYKTFRNWVLEQFEQERPFVVVGGFTGTGKTDILKSLKAKGEMVIDLEQLAHHRGSAFGNLGMPAQPGQEMFENKLALELWKSGSSNEAASVWVEDESQRIGNVNTPHNLFRYLRTKHVLFVDLDFEERLKNIIKDYGSFEKQSLEDAINRITKRLGGVETKNAIMHLQQDDIESCFRILLTYYDKMYLKSLQLRDNWEALVTRIECKENDPGIIAETLIKQRHQQIKTNAN